MGKPRVLIFSGYGLNCEEETKFAFEQVGAKAEIVHVNDLIKNPKRFSKYQIAAFPGGFSYGDDTGSGNAYAHRIKNHLWDNFLGFVRKDKLIIGICNGFQILANLGVLPALNKNYGQREVALLHNDSARYTVRWTDLKVENNQSPWLAGLNNLSLPIAHSEGKFYAPPKILNELKKKRLIALRYVSFNPNGSLFDIAGITDETGRILGLMPHPERAIFFTQLPDWPYLKEKYQREGKEIPKNGPGLQIFQDAVNYFS